MNDIITYYETRISKLSESIDKINLINSYAWKLRKVDTKKAFAMSNEALMLAENLNSKKGLADSYRTIGFCQWYFTNYALALEKSMKAMSLYINLDDKKAEIQVMNTIAKVYNALSDYDKALLYFNKCIHIAKNISDYEEEAISLSNLGDMYMKLGDYDKALDFFITSINLNEGVNHFTQALVKYNIGEAYYHKGFNDNALEYLQASLSLSETIDYPLITTASLCVMGKLYVQQNKLPEAIESLNKAIVIAKNIDSKLDIYQAKEALAEAYEKNNEVEKAFEQFKAFHKYKNEVFNHQNIQQVKNIQFQYDILSVKKETEDERVKNTALKKAYNEIEKQRNVITEKNKSITDSIKYAKRIQEAILPPDKLIEKLFDDCFIYYTPKDIVCGDFYWVNTIQTETDDLILFAAVDCTGHGVPGAFMSLVGHSILNTAIKEKHILQPAAILNFLNEGVTKTLRQTYEESSVRDGMDLALCSWNKNTNTLQFAGANNPLWLIRNGELIEFKGDKFPVGIFLEEQMKHFTHHELKLYKGDMIYLFSDGYSDQFGGDKEKKFTKKRLKEKLLSIHHLPMEKQHSELKHTMRNWQKNNEQVDDILIMGIRF